MKKITCGLVTVMIGREFSLEPLLGYFKQVKVPKRFNELNLYLVLGCDDEFESHLKNRISEIGLSEKYNQINFIKGNKKCYSNLNWEEWEIFTRSKETLLKHRSALINIDIGLNSAKHETYIHFVDDDTIPPNNALVDLYKSYNKIYKCGISSGIYFNKKWLGPTIVTCEDELDRRIVCSINKEVWEEISIDDLTTTDYENIGFVGNGCMLAYGDDIKKVIPLQEYRELYDDTAAPDLILCRRIRNLGKRISIVPSVIAKHLDQNGNPVGLSESYLESIKLDRNLNKILILHYTKYLNYQKLSKMFDEILVISTKETKSMSLDYLKDIKNLQIIEKSIEDTCNKYLTYSKLDGKSRFYSILEEMYSYIKDKSNYKFYNYRTSSNDIVELPTIDTSKLKKLLNTKP
jgi:cellulose synthase/poly-beta-1,6-N-acetylglucosamine synthase-like glycosyltransferase